MDEKDLENINQIDMECSISDDDDFVVTNHGSTITSDEDRPTVSKTGVMINLNDGDEDLGLGKRVIKAEISIKNPDIIITAPSPTSSEDSFKDINAIDMETKYGEDDDFPAQEEDEDMTFDNKEFIDEDMIEEKKTTPGAVEADYWKKLQAKHKSSNKKGAYNTSFHIAGNPEAEMKMFNHEMGSDSIAAAPASASSDGGAVATGGGEGCCESLEINPCDELKPVFDVLGFEVLENSDGSLLAMDCCNTLPDINAKNLPELFKQLAPYIEDCFIYPLQIETGEIFDDCGDWVNWYTKDKADRYPNCKSDIDYCKLIEKYISA